MSDPRKKIPLFDIDWTLLKGANPVHDKAFDYAVSKVFSCKRSKREVESEGMIDKQILIEILKLDGFTKKEVMAKIPEAIKCMEEYFLKHVDETEYITLPGVESLLAALEEEEGMVMGLLNGNIEVIARKKLERVGISNYFKFGAFGNMAYTREELVEIARQQAERFVRRAVDLKELVIIGDAPRDIRCAKRTRIQSIGVATGKFSESMLEYEGAELVVNSLKEERLIIDFLT